MQEEFKERDGWSLKSSFLIIEIKVELFISGFNNFFELKTIYQSVLVMVSPDFIFLFMEEIMDLSQ